MENSSLEEVGEYNEIISPEDVEVEEVLNRVLQKKKKCMGWKSCGRFS